MSTSPPWFVECRRLALVVLLSGFLGYMLGHTLVLVSVALLIVLVYFVYQLRRVDLWLRDPDTEPPESHGLWGHFFDRMYLLQRQNRQARAELQSTVNYLRDSFASMNDATVMVDEHSAIEWANVAAESLLGLRIPADQGQGVLNLLRYPEFHRYYNGLDYSEPLLFSTSTEAEQYLQVQISFFGEGNRLIFARDITELTRMENVRRDFVGNVSHELRTPLTVITGYVDTLLANSQNLPESLVKPLKQMSQQSARMENLLKDLLWLSRIESVRDEDKPDRVDVRGLLDELRDELCSSYPGRSLTFEVTTDHQVLGEHQQLYSAISNLLINAIKYSPEDSVVRVSWTKEPRGYVLAVRDSGAGIDASHVPRLTERFYRVDDSRSSRTGGTGLGLAIVKHVAASHHAQLTIESVPGVGSSFSLIFPAT